MFKAQLVISIKLLINVWNWGGTAPFYNSTCKTQGCHDAEEVVISLWTHVIGQYWLDSLMRKCHPKLQQKNSAFLDLWMGNPCMTDGFSLKVAVIRKTFPYKDSVAFCYIHHIIYGLQRYILFHVFLGGITCKSKKSFMMKCLHDGRWLKIIDFRVWSFSIARISNDLANQKQTVHLHVATRWYPFSAKYFWGLSLSNAMSTIVYNGWQH